MEVTIATHNRPKVDRLHNLRDPVRVKNKPHIDLKVFVSFGVIFLIHNGSPLINKMNQRTPRLCTYEWIIE